MVSIGKMLLQVAGMCDTSDLTDWENTFLKSMMDRTQNGKDTSGLSEKQVNAIVSIFDSHCG